jgi:hypothetical protein
MKVKKPFSAIFAILLILGAAMAIYAPQSSASSTTYLKMVNPATGQPLFNYTVVEPPPTASGYPLGYILMNVSVQDVVNLATWQINITWNPDVLRLASPADLILPPDNVFNGWADPVEPVITPSSVFWVVGIKLGAPFDHFDGSGTLCQIKFNVTKVPTQTETPLHSLIHFVLAGEHAFYTKLIDVEGNLISYQPVDAEYYYYWVKPPLPKPWLSVYPSRIEKGKPLGPSIIGTPKARFTVSVIINNLVNDSMLTLIQFAFKYPTDLFVLVPYNATFAAEEGPFLKHPEWAPYGTDFLTNYGGIDEEGIETWYIVACINPNPATGNFDWGMFPDTTGLSGAERVICTFTFEATVQEEYPWTEFVSGAFDIDYLFPQYPIRMFLDANDEWIPGQPPVDGDYFIQGWVLGLMLDVYTQYPEPYGGQGLNETSDMFTPQQTVELYAKLTYNGDPVQNKEVVFQIVGNMTTGYVNFTRVATTDSNGIAYVTFGIPWPCNKTEAQKLFGIWQVVASATVREQTVKDWLWFKVNWLTMNLKITPKNTGEFKKGENAEFTVTFSTYRRQPVSVLIVVTIFDDLNVPVGRSAIWVTVGDPQLPWCESKPYSYNFTIPLPKWAFAGEGTAYVDVLTNWPFECGVPVCPEASTTFTIIRYTT